MIRLRLWEINLRHLRDEERKRSIEEAVLTAGVGPFVSYFRSVGLDFEREGSKTMLPVYRRGSSTGPAE